METQSQTSTALLVSRKKEETEKVLSGSRERKSDRLALLDITNDPPIFGFSVGSLEISSAAAKKSGPTQQTLSKKKKVEEDADFPKLSFDQRRFLHFPQGLVSSPPASILGPTSVNTPCIPFPLKEGINGGFAVMPVPEENDSKINQETDDLRQETLRSSKNLNNHTLLFDSLGKEEISDTSTFSSESTFQECLFCERWDLDSDASSQGEEEMGEVDYEEVIREVEDYGKEIIVEDEGGLVNELCEGLIVVKVIGELEDEELMRDVQDYGKEILVEDEGGLINELSEGLIEVKVIGEEDDSSPCSVPVKAISGEEEEMGEVEYGEVMREVQDYGKEILVEEEGGLINQLCEGLIEVEVIGQLEDCYEEVRGEVKDCEETMESEDGGLTDESCEGLERVYDCEKGGIPGFRGQHAQFIYYSDDHIKGDEEVSLVSPSILCLKSIPIPEGKRLCFPEEED